MIFIFIALILFLFLFQDIPKRLCALHKGHPEKSEDTSEDGVPYEVIDAIASLREEVKNVEDLISVLEAAEQNDESGISVNFTDASGNSKFKACANEELLRYLYSERLRIRKQLSKIISTL